MSFFQWFHKNKKRNAIASIAGATLGTLGLVAPSLAEENSPEWNAWVDTNIVSSYLSGSSGNVINENPSIQPCVGITRKDGLTFSVGADYTLGDKEYDAKFTEVDPSINIPLPKGWPVNGSLYGGLFIVPDGNTTGEIGIYLSPKKQIFGLDTKLYLGQAILNEPSSANGRVATGFASKKFNLTDKLSSTIGADISWTDDYSGADGLSPIGLKGNLEYSLGNGWNIKAGVRQQIPIRKSADSYTVGSIGFSKSF